MINVFYFFRFRIAIYIGLKLNARKDIKNIEGIKKVDSVWFKVLNRHY